MENLRLGKVGIGPEAELIRDSDGECWVLAETTDLFCRDEDWEDATTDSEPFCVGFVALRNA
jgi:hypothetical protein